MVQRIKIEIGQKLAGQITDGKALAGTKISALIAISNNFFYQEINAFVLYSTTNLAQKNAMIDTVKIFSHIHLQII